MTPEQMRALNDKQLIDFLRKKSFYCEIWENNYVLGELQNRLFDLARRGAERTTLRDKGSLEGNP